MHYQEFSKLQTVVDIHCELTFSIITIRPTVHIILTSFFKSFNYVFQTLAQNFLSKVSLCGMNYPFPAPHCMYSSFWELLAYNTISGVPQHKITFS